MPDRFDRARERGYAEARSFPGYIDTVPTMTRIIVLVCCVVYVVSLRIPELVSALCFAPEHMMTVYTHWPRRVMDSSLAWRVLGAQLIHADFWHLLHNMTGLVTLGAWYERRVGSIVYIYHILLFAWLQTVGMTVLTYQFGWYNMCFSS